MKGKEEILELQSVKMNGSLEIDADERVDSHLSEEILNTIKNSEYDWHQIKVDNFINNKLVTYGWGAYFGKSSYAGLFKKNVKFGGCREFILK